MRLITGLLSGLLFASGAQAAAAKAAAENSVDADAPATAPLDGAALYQQHCAACHEGGKTPRAPHAIQFTLLGPRAVERALTSGLMQAQGAKLSAAERRVLAEHLGGATLDAHEAVPPKRCDVRRARFDAAQPPVLDGWSFDLRGTRAIPAAVAKLTAADLPNLAVNWAFAYPGATRARSQPNVAGGAVYVGSQDGTVYALDFETGCVRWTFAADAEVRTTVSIEPWRAGDRRARPRAYFGDLLGNVYAVDARSGRLLWRVRPHPHPKAIITGSPRLYGKRLYVPVSSTEWSAAADPAYECCTFRGAVIALDTATGAVAWRAYAIPEEARDTGRRNSAGARMMHAAGAIIWNTPTIDVKRQRLYVGTGQAYTSPAAPTSNAVLAIDLATGAIAWSYQSIAGDAWNMACFLGDGANCPSENGPDVDVSSPPILYTDADGRDRLLVGQKSADVFSLDPDANGALLWRVKYGRGGLGGGVHWGMAFANDTLYAPNSDNVVTGKEVGEARPGLFALDPKSGAIRWFAPAPDACRPGTKPVCDPGYSPPPTYVPGLVFQSSFDGWLRAYDADVGRLLWSFDTSVEFDTVSGAKARGGSLEAIGPLVVNGHVLLNSGYGYFNRMPGNVLLMLGPSRTP